MFQVVDIPELAGEENLDSCFPCGDEVPKQHVRRKLNCLWSTVPITVCTVCFSSMSTTEPVFRLTLVTDDYFFVEYWRKEIVCKLEPFYDIHRCKMHRDGLPRCWPSLLENLYLLFVFSNVG